MNNIGLTLFFRFVLLILVQVLVLNHVNFLGYINPYLYVMFILIYPVDNNRLFFIFIAFLLGLSVDMFSDSGGVHAAASVFIAYIRPVVLKFAFGTSYEFHTIKFNQSEMGPRLTYFFILIILHHLLLFALEVFNWSQTLLVLKKTLFSGIFTLTLSLLITILFSDRKR